MYGSNDNQRTVPDGKGRMVERATAEETGESDVEPEQAAEPTIEAPPSHVPAPNISDQRVYLAVPFDEKDDAKEIGARWDGRSKAWYVPPGTDLAPFTSWLPAKNSVQIAVDANPVEQFAEALRESGLRLDGPPVMDGQLHRVVVEGDRGKQRSGTYSGHLDGRPAGFIQNFKTGTRTNWKAQGQAAALGARDRALLAATAAQSRHDRAREREQQAERTAQQVDVLWAAATPALEHPYLADKSVQAHGLRQDETGRLLVPVQDAGGKIWSVQRIGKDGFKQFEVGGRVEGGHFIIGDVKEPGPLLIAEGFATAATLNELTDMPAIVAFNAGNLAKVAMTYRSLYPDRAIIIAGDNDHQAAAEGKPNVGRCYAENAAALVGGHALLPSFSAKDAGSDWNDLARLQGAGTTRQQLMTAIAALSLQVQPSSSRDEQMQERRGIFSSLGAAVGRMFNRDRGAADRGTEAGR